MTYIVTGKLKNCCFLMADCISTNKKENKQSYRDKLYKLTSSENEYFSFTGTVLVSHALQILDTRLKQLNLSHDFFIGSDSIKLLLDVIQKFLDVHPDKKNVNLGDNRLFFVNKNQVVYHDIKYNNLNEIIEYSGPIELKENMLVDSVLNFPPEQIEFRKNEEVEDFCTRHITEISKQYKIDFKRRFSFILLNHNGEIIEKRPYKHFSDMIAEYYDLDYNIIDDKSFQWDIQ
jgi:hypothetical protein